MPIELHSLVVVSCHTPIEKLWGVLLRLDHVGVELRGLDVASVEDWLAQEREPGDSHFIVPSTVFVPLHRVERVYLDEGSPLAPSFEERHREDSGGDVRVALGAIDAEEQE